MKRISRIISKLKLFDVPQRISEPASMKGLSRQVREGYYDNNFRL